MKDIEDGGPAFPTPPVEGWTNGDEGMSLRDWYAGQALAGILAVTRGVEPPGETAEEAYAYADAMLQEREK